MQESPVEKIKKSSRNLRGSLDNSLINNHTNALADDDSQLVKFHGIYQQDDRDRRAERLERKLEQAWSFMIRLRLPGGDMLPQQWVALARAAAQYSSGVIKITTRQTIQLHGIIKSELRPTIETFNTAALDSIATCGDINRNVASSSHPAINALHKEVHAYAQKISNLLMPKSRAWYEIWLGEEKLAGYDETDPLYENRYLPRKLKIGIAIPPNNDSDVLTNDIGLIAIIENNKLQGFNIAIGGGLSQTHGNAATYPRLATVIGFAQGEENILRTVYEIVTVQRDHGNRGDRKLARMKYTVDKLGVDYYKKLVEERSGYQLEPARNFLFEERRDWQGWTKDDDGKWTFGLIVENGRILNEEDHQILNALNAIAEKEIGQFRFTSNQNVLLTNLSEAEKLSVEEILVQYGVDQHQQKMSALRRNSMACVALPTCPLALAEAQRYLPELISKLEPVFAKHELSSDEVIIRMTGCPNGCGRSVAAEIGLIGTAPGTYNLQVGGDREGLRLNRLYKKDLQENAIIEQVDELLGAYKKESLPNETIGDFLNRFVAFQ